MRKIDQIRRSESEDICVFLQEAHGAPHVELRVCQRSTSPGGDSLPGTEGIAVPVDVIPDLLRALAQTRERLVQEGLTTTDAPPEETPMETGEPNALAAAASPRSYSRLDSRDHLRLPVGCRLLHAADSPSYEVTGETEDVSTGGVQVWLPERFSLLSRVQVSMQIGGLNFRGQAEVVDVDAEARPTLGGYRHSLRWTGLTFQEKTVVSQAILDSGLVGGRDTRRIGSRQMEM